MKGRAAVQTTRVKLYTSRESRVVVISLRAFRGDSCQLKNHESSRVTRVAGVGAGYECFWLCYPTFSPSLQNRSTPRVIGSLCGDQSARPSGYLSSLRPLRTADVSPSGIVTNRCNKSPRLTFRDLFSGAFPAASQAIHSRLCRLTFDLSHRRDWYFSLLRDSSIVVRFLVYGSPRARSLFVAPGGVI
jgi:hypothetical protein